MKRFLFAVLLIAVAAAAEAGVSYKFSSKVDKGAGSMVGMAEVEGSQMRLEVSQGDKVLFGDNSVILSRDGGETLIVLNPKDKTFYEIQLAEMFGAMGNVMKSMGGMFKMNIDNQKVTVKDAGDGGMVEGFPTTRYVTDASYDLVMEMMGRKMVTSITTQTETWSTDKLDRHYMTFVQQKGFRTGMEDLDRLIQAQSSEMKGFPLKQVTRTTSTQGKKSETSTTTVTISEIEEKKVPASRFEIPAGYQKTEGPLEGLKMLQQR